MKVLLEPVKVCDLTIYRQIDALKFYDVIVAVFESLLDRRVYITINDKLVEQPCRSIDGHKHGDEYILTVVLN